MSFLSQPISLIPIQPLRKIGDITVNVVINENTTDALSVTKQPVQQGATITDHAYKEPISFSTSIYFSSNLDKSLSQIYQQLIALQESRVPFDIVTPKRIYNNMLMTTLSQTTDKNTENTLAISASFQEIIIVSVSTTTVPRSKQKNPARTGATQPGGKKSALLSLTQGVTGLFGGTQ